MVAVITDERAAEIDGQLGPPIHVLRERVVRIAGEEHEVRIKPYQGGTLAVTDEGDLMDIIGRCVPGQRLLSVTVDGRHRIVQVRRAGRDWQLQTRGRTHKVQVLKPARRRIVEAHARQARARSVAAAAGADAGASDPARRRGRRQGRAGPAGRGDGSDEDGKYPPRTSKAATVKATPAKAGDSLAVDQVIVEFE